MFRDRFFRTRSIQWTTHDLERLLKVSEHADFGSALQHLRINATPTHSVSLWQLRKRISECDAITSDPYGVLFKSELQEQYVKEEAEAKDLATFFNETRHDQKCLRAVFKKIDCLESITLEYRGMDKMFGKFSRRYCEASQHEMSRPFVSTMKAVADAGIYVKVIRTDAQFHHGAISIGRLESLAPVLKSFDSAFDKLERLEIALRDWRRPDAGFELETTRAPFIVRFLAKARHVKCLSLSCYSSLDVELFGEVARYCKFTRLETCRLGNMIVRDASELCQLLAPSYSTLRDLSLTHLLLWDNHLFTWRDFLEHLASDDDILPALERLSVSRPTIGRIGNLESSLGTVFYGTMGHKTWRAEILSGILGFGQPVSGPRELGSTAYPFIEMVD